MSRLQLSLANLSKSGCGVARLRSFASHVPADREDVPIGILEPGHFVAVGSGPDAERLVLHKRIFLEHYAAFLQPFHYPFDVLYLPAEDGVLRRGKVLDLGDPDQVLSRAHDQGEGIVADKLESKFAFIEFASTSGVPSWDKSDELAGAEHASLLAKMTL